MMKLIEMVTALNMTYEDTRKSENKQIDSYVDQAVKVKLNPLSRN